MASRVLTRIPKANPQFLLLRASLIPRLFCGFYDFSRPATSLSKWLPNDMSLSRHPYHKETIIQRFGFSSSAFPQATPKERSQSGDHEKNTSKVSEPTQETSEAGVVSESTEANSIAAESDQPNSAELELSVEELLKLVAERDNLLKVKQKEIEEMQEKVLRTYAEMENVRQRTRREVENSKKYGIQNFAKGLLDVADNLGRASTAVKENFSKIDQTSDNVGVTLLKSLLEGVEMTEKQLAEVFKKFGIQKYDALNENFDPNRHNAVFEIPDASKPVGIVAAVLKPGYMLYDRVLRPAEVGVSKALPDEK